MSDLRDHSQPCEHGKLMSHDNPGVHQCPGGREVTIDYERLIGKAAGKSVRFHDMTEWDAFAVASETIGMVAAAIGDADDTA